MAEITVQDQGDAGRPDTCEARSMDLAVGGQALIEGVMMRSPSYLAMAVRTPDGRIVIRKKIFNSIVRRLKFLNIPVLRGGVHLIETMGLGIDALMFSADQAISEDRVEGKKASFKETLMMWGTVAFSFALSLALFFYLPIYLTDLVVAESEGSLVWNMVDGLIRVLMFVLYLFAVSRFPDMARVFEYHGAEHKSIHVYEAGEELTVANAAKYPTFHPRCGTSFLVFVILISIGFFAAAFPVLQTYLIPETLTGWKLNLLQASIKVPMMVPIAGISFEFIKWAGRKKNEGASGPFFDLLVVPGRMMQKLTTIEPDDKQLEVALVSLRRALEHEGALQDPDWSGVTFLAAEGA